MLLNEMQDNHHLDAATTPLFHSLSASVPFTMSLTSTVRKNNFELLTQTARHKNSAVEIKRNNLNPREKREPKLLVSFQANFHRA